jgi:hypothetical protein
MDIRPLSPLLCLMLVSCTALKPPVFEKHDTLRTARFESSEELDQYIDSVKKLHAYRKSQMPKISGDEEERIEVTGSRVRASDVGITNNQVAGVDEGDIVKLSGDYLLTLRHGQLSSIAIRRGGKDALIHIGTINVFPDSWRYDTWYDEMLVVEDRVLVLGYNYDLGASEVHRLQLNSDGRLVYQDGFLFKSSDYYDSENYAARVKDGKLVIYMPTPLLKNARWSDEDAEVGWPKFVKISDWKRDNTRWTDAVTPKDVFKPVRPALDPTLHTFVSCSVVSPDISCSGVSFISETRAEYFVSNEHVYLWSRSWQESDLLNYQFSSYRRTDELPMRGATNDRPVDASICQIDLSSINVGCVAVDGIPRNQFSFHVENGALYAALDYEADRNEMRYMGLYKVPLEAFGRANPETYKPFILMPSLPDPINMRFVNGFLFTGSQTYDREKIEAIEFVLATSLASGKTKKVALSHAVDRLEVLDDHVFVSGSTQRFDLAYSILENNGGWRNILSRTMYGLVEDESRSHAFNFHQFDRGTRIIGFTTLSKDKLNGEPGYYFRDDDTPTDITFVGYSLLAETFDAGKLTGRALPKQMKSACESSCIDWYGNSRPFFIGNRIFGLTGDELIEARYIGEKVKEINRIRY